MVALIGLMTLGALIWLLAFSMKTESEAETRRRAALSAAVDGEAEGPGLGTKRAA